MSKREDGEVKETPEEASKRLNSEWDKMSSRTEGFMIDNYHELIKIIKPEWFERDEDGSCFAKSDKCPLFYIERIWDETSHQWITGDDDWRWKKMLKTTTKECVKALESYKDEMEGKDE